MTANSHAGTMASAENRGDDADMIGTFQSPIEWGRICLNQFRQWSLPSLQYKNDLELLVQELANL